MTAPIPASAPTPEAQSGGPDDRPEVRVFTLADHVATPPDGKLYISGAGVGTIYLPAIPGPMTALWLAVRVRVPWHMTLEPLVLKIRLLDADRNPVGIDPLVEAQTELGRPPGSRPGDEAAVNVPVNLAGLPIQREGTVYFHLLLGEELLSVLPLKIAPAAGRPPTVALA